MHCPRGVRGNIWWGSAVPVFITGSTSVPESRLQGQHTLNWGSFHDTSLDKQRYGFLFECTRMTWLQVKKHGGHRQLLCEVCGRCLLQVANKTRMSWSTGYQQESASSSTLTTKSLQCCSSHFSNNDYVTWGIQYIYSTVHTVYHTSLRHSARPNKHASCSSTQGLEMLWLTAKLIEVQSSLQFLQCLAGRGLWWCNSRRARQVFLL